MRILFLTGFALFILSACQQQEIVVRLSGKTMGTTYNIVAITKSHIEKNRLKQEIEAKLQLVNQHLSNWDPKSEISKFNNSNNLTPVNISNMLAKIMGAANLVHDKSDGLFDVTLGPLIDLWGFGSNKSEMQVPSEEKIQHALSKVGQNRKLRLNQETMMLQKLNRDTEVNLSAIAKGFGVDELADTLSQHGIKNYMVEIGGDLTARGHNPKGAKWKIGIEHPDPEGRRIKLLTQISNMAMATSGDYRNYFEKNGVRYSHIMDVKTGRPVTHKTASVTVIAENAMMADAWATALLVLGEVEGMKIAKKNNLAAFFIFKLNSNNSKTFKTSMSPRFEALHNQK